jgi:hypothetical protein
MSDGKLISSKELVIEGKTIPVKVVDESGSKMANIIIARDQVRELVYWWICRAITAPLRGITVVVRNTIVFSVEEWEKTLTGVHQVIITQQMERIAHVLDAFRQEILRIKDGDYDEKLK